MSWFLVEVAREDWILLPASQLTTRNPTRCIGPFRTRVAASWYHRYGRHLGLPASADTIELLAAQDERMAQERVLQSMTPEERREALEFEEFESFFDEQRLSHVDE